MRKFLCCLVAMRKEAMGFKQSGLRGNDLLMSCCSSRHPGSEVSGSGLSSPPLYFSGGLRVYSQIRMPFVPCQAPINAGWRVLEVLVQASSSCTCSWLPSCGASAPEPTPQPTKFLSKTYTTDLRFWGFPGSLAEILVVK